MRIEKILGKEIIKKIVCSILLIVIALLSIFVISKPATSPESYKTTIESIDEKKGTVMGITAAAAATSAALAVIPGDSTTPIANQLMEMSTYLLIVVCVLVLEKSLLTVMGYLSFNILIPIACLLFGIYTFINKKVLKMLAIKFVVLSLVIVSIIPIGLRISDLIYDVNKNTIEQISNDIEDNEVIEENEEEKSHGWGI